MIQGVDEVTLRSLYRLYGLQRDPFVLDPLQPESAADCEEMYTRVEGFDDHKDVIDGWFSNPERLKQRSLIVVYSPKHCGRTSVANYVYRRFVLAYQSVKQLKIKLLRTEIQDDDAFRPVADIIFELYEYLQELPGASVDNSELKQLVQDLQKVLESIATATEYTYKLLLNRVLKYLSVHQQTTLAVILEDIRSETTQTGFFDRVFVGIPFLLFTTFRNEVYAPYRLAHAPTLPIELHELTLKDLETFLNRRWAELTGNAAAHHPFPEPALEQMCPSENITRPLQGVIDVLDRIFTAFLKEKVAPQVPWPEIGPPIGYEFVGPKMAFHMEQVGVLVRGPDDQPRPMP